jgi:hypothetical protein
MNKTQQFLIYALFLTFVSFQFTSCSKDSDLLSDYVINEEIGEFSNLVVNDNFYIAQGETAILDVLVNDQFTSLENVTILDTTAPQNGTVTINEDNTLTYTANTAEPAQGAAPEEALPDNFAYTAEETAENGEVISEEGIVNINIANRSPQVNFSAYGVVGDGIKDDTAALQAALDSEENLIADENSIFLITKTLNITQGFMHFIDWNGAIIRSNINLNPMISIDKRTKNGGDTVMKDFFVDGNEKSTRGFVINSKVNFSNIDLTGFRQPTSSSPAGIIVNIHNENDSMGDYVFDGCDITNIVGASNGSTTDSMGAANGMIVYWKALPSISTRVIIRNANINNSWGEDAGGLYFLDQTGGNNAISNSSSSILVENVNITDIERRNVKGFCGNLTFLNCTFEDPLPSNPNLYSSNKSGMVVIGGNPGRASNILFQGCIFTGRGYDGRVIPVNATNVKINNCLFKGSSDLALTQSNGNIDVCSSTFNSGSTIYDYNAGSDFGQIRLDTDNVYEDGYAATENLSAFSSVQSDLICIP